MHAHTTPLRREEHGELVFDARLGSLRALLDDEITVVGRARDCPVQLPHPDVSQRHAQLRRLGPVLYELTDLGSRNGTFVNGAPVRGTTVLKLGDTVRFGRQLSATLLLHDPAHERMNRRKRLLAMGRLADDVCRRLCNLSTVLQASSDYLEGAEQRLGDPLSRQALDDVRRAADDASWLLGQLLDFAAGRGSRGSIDVSQVCADIAELAARTLAEGLRLDADIAPGLTCPGDELDLRLVLLHMLSGACAAPGRRGTLVVAAAKVERQVRVAVRRELLRPSADAPALGTFSAVVADDLREVVVRMGGSIEVDRASGSAELLLPALPPPVTPSTEPKRGARGGKRSASAAVVVVDDEPVLRRSARRVLERAGHRAHVAGTVSEALALVETVNPDAVLVDVHLAGEDGLALVDALRAERPDLAVVVMSGMLSPKLEREIRQLGARSCLAKPWSPQQLVDAIAAATEADEPVR